MLVVGAPESSNSNRLVEVAAKLATQSHLIQSAEDLNPDWLQGVERIGVSAGASSPEFLVQQVLERLKDFCGPETTVASLSEVREDVTFKLPSELRE